MKHSERQRAVTAWRRFRTFEMKSNLLGRSQKMKLTRLVGLVLGSWAIALWAGSDWGDAQREMNSRLQKPGATIASLVQEVSNSKPADAQAALLKLAVLMRAGITKGATNALQELKTLQPDLEGSQINSIYYEATDRLEAWDIAQALLEMFPGNITDLTLESRLVRHWLAAGRSVDDIDAWLAARPPGKNAFWRKERLRFLNQHGRGEALEKEWTANVRSSPRDIPGAIAFLEAVYYARTSPRQFDFSWMTDVLKPARSTEAQELAARLQNLEAWPAAIFFYRQAITIPLTNPEIVEMSRMRQVMQTGEVIAAGFQAHLREGLSQCLLANGASVEAQKWMVEAQDIRAKHKLGRNTFLAGEVQARSEARTIEERIKTEAKTSEQDPQYWSDRASYYAGRSEPGLQEEALKKGLALTVPKPRPERGFKGYMDWRSNLLRQYATFLDRHRRKAEGAALLLKEIADAPADADSADAAVRALWFDFTAFIRVDDERLWTWLSHRPKWSHNEERLLWEVLQTAPKADRDKYFTRAEGMASGQDPTRAHSLGWVMNRMNNAPRSIPLLKSAAERATDKELRETATFTLFESYLDTGDWKPAEELLPVASQRLTANEVSEWSGRLAVVAAKAGAKSDALRLWCRVAKSNPASLRDLERLAKLGLRNELIEFYRNMRQEMPDSEIPQKALALLGGGN